MKFEEVLPALREGKKITNSTIKNSGYQYIYYFGKTIFCGGTGGYWHLTDREIVDSDDWEVIKEPKKVKKKVKLRDLTKEQYKKYENHCADRICAKCPFVGVQCNSKSNNCWINHKDLYNDKFLDQEIEIKE